MKKDEGNPQSGVAAGEIGGGKPSNPDSQTVMAPDGRIASGTAPPSTAAPEARTMMGVAPAAAGPQERTVMASGTGAKGRTPPRPPMVGKKAGGGATAVLSEPPPSMPLASGPPPGLSQSGVSQADVSQGGGLSYSDIQPSVSHAQSTDGGTGVQSILPKPGTRINQFELIRELGAGGMGTVYLARDTKLGRRVAIKFLQTTHPELSQRFIVEARATARVAHENIVIIYEVGEWHGSPYMVLEYLQGQPLNKMIEGGQKLPPARAVEIMLPVVKALVTAHEAGIVHRDLKPDNIFVTESGTIKVLDFGIAKVVQGEGAGQRERPSDARAVAAAAAAADGEEENTNLTRHGAIMGTLAYMSPEQWGIGVEIDHRTDIWACGIMLYRMLTGKHPLDPLRGEQLVVTAILDEPMPKAHEHNPELPVELCEIVDKCLLKRKEQRFADAKAFLRALEPFQPGRFVSSTRQVSIEESPYAGLSAFQEADSDKFFGRNREIAAMSLRIRDRPIMAVVGPSGVGKSSFIRAGLVPSLKHSGEKWECMVIRPGRNPLAALASVLSPLIGSSTTLKDDMAEQTALMNRLAAEPGYLGTALRNRARRSGQHTLLFVDQFEELYTLVQDPKERQAFTACLSGAADDPTSPMRVVISIRSDFLDRAAEDPHFMNELSQGLFFMTAPTRDGMRDALTQPAEMAGYQFESLTIVEEMLDHLATTNGALPLLQFTAAKLWMDRDPARKMLTEKAYRAIGGVAGALASHADRVLQKLSQQQLTLARAIMLRLVTPDRTRAIIALDDLKDLSREAGEVQNLVDHLVQARLLTVNTGGGATGATVEIVHESLITTWPMLRRWLDESGEDSAFLEQLRNAAKQWQQKGRGKDLLWRGELAEEAQRFQRRFRGELPEAQRAFLKATSDLKLSGVRRRRALVVAGGLLLGAIAAGATVAMLVVRESQKKAEENAAAAIKAEGVARLAEAEAKRNLEEVKRKEIERQKAEAAQKEAELEKRKADVQVELTNEELKIKNEELVGALEKAEEARKRAKEAQEEAEDNAEAAKAAREEAIQAALQLEALLERERDRVKRLTAQIGSPVIDDLKGYEELK